ncbi:hypothetical protein M426DRAFT_19015 [Hypoxylon sp. CI-4A]|nr:hypothetical protein M426DRAFT_19015 [Hypoxylon sp. CI-4A]
MTPERERYLAHALLVELVAHQFTFPVRWIETQDIILGEKNAERIVEIGPSNTLTDMMKKTWGQNFTAKDQSRGITRRMLGPKGNLDEIYYRISASDEAIEEEDPEEPAKPKTQQQQQHNEPNQAPARDDTVLAEGPSTRPPEDIQDVPMAAGSIVLAIVGIKLKKRPEEIQPSQSINALVGGRSTLSNEIKGDLEAEFPNQVPERSEEISLDDLGQSLQNNFDGRLGKSTTSMVTKMISSKFPAGYGQSSIRKLLQKTWGLGTMRQDSVLLSAITDQPASRMASVEDAEKFLGGVVREYFEKEGLAVPRRGVEGKHTQNTAIDPKALQIADEKRNKFIRSIIEVLGGEVESTTNDEDYADGIRPIFDTRKERVYDSWWNWDAQDIALLAMKMTTPELHSTTSIEELSTSILNRVCDRSLSQFQFMISSIDCDGLCDKALRKTMHILYDACVSRKDQDPVFINRLPDLAPLTTVDFEGTIVTSEISRAVSETKLLIPVSTIRDGVTTFSQSLSAVYSADLDLVTRSGVTLAGKSVLLTGAGKNSIGIHLLQYLLSGGARVTVTTSSFSAETAYMYQRIYARHGARGSALRVLPFNQGSRQDVENLIHYFDSDTSWELDFVVPFAAMSENGREVDGLDSKSEIAHRLMLTNLLRLVGGVAQSKRSRGIDTRPAIVVLPLSPNHGVMGGDGLYAESKVSLEPLLTKWESESWKDYLSLLGVTIGWTRGTGLMNSTDTQAHAVEELGVRTFAATEMAANIVTLMGGSIAEQCHFCPLIVDLGGNLGSIKGLKAKLTKIRRELNSRADIQRAIRDEERQQAIYAHGGGIAEKQITLPQLSPRANHQLEFPKLLDYDKDISNIALSLEGMVDLSRVVVVTGFSELGPHGSSRTRWEMEVNGTLSLEGCIELAWMMGFIEYRTSIAKDGSQISGWSDRKTGSPIDDADVYTTYMAKILENTGIRRIDPTMCDNGYDPANKESLLEVVLDRDLPSFEASPEVAKELQHKHGDKAKVTQDGDGTCHIQLKSGAAVMVPRASTFNRTVAGQIPTGWSAKRYGISDDIIEQVDPVTLFSLVCTVEALLSSGVVDPYEWYQHIHVSELGNCVGSSMGGVSSVRKMHRDRFIGKSVQSDVLQETFINTTGAWINMLLTSSAGPIRTPVGACATSLESLDTGYDLIVAKKAKVCLVGGVEDFVEDVTFEFGSMKATCDTEAEFAAGRTPREMSRPTASSRSGFVESQGCGVQVLTSAELALEMGLPIYGVVALSNMSADKAGRSVPAPGKGVLTNARETKVSGNGVSHWPLLDLEHRRRMLDRRRQQIADQVRDSLALLEETLRQLMQQSTKTDCLAVQQLDEYRHQATAAIYEDAHVQGADAAFSLGNNFWKRDGKDQISPIRGALATWGLTVDDISVASLHGTSTVKNDLNEPSVIQEQMRHLGRQEGNLLPGVCQKWLTGHPKGAAGAWMINGCLQMMHMGLIPGNRNVDNIDKDLQQHSYMFFPGETIPAGNGGIKACSVTSFGFGQKGAQALLVHPRYLFGTISKERYNEYTKKKEERYKKASKVFTAGMVDNNMLGRCVKTQPPYKMEDLEKTLLDPMCCVVYYP